MSSGFITEAELEEKRRVRQEQWDMVRKAEEPKEVPEETIETRSLFERLKEQKDRKQDEFEEARKLKNLVKTLDDEEVQFLDYVEQVRYEDDKRKRLEEAKELSEFRNAVSEFRASEMEKAIQLEIKNSETKRSKPTGADFSIGLSKTSRSQLAGLVKRKSLSEPIVPPKKLKSLNDTEIPATLAENSDNQDTTVIASPSTSTPCQIIESIPHKGNLVCIGVLPGLASYDDSSDDDEDNSTDAIGTTDPRLSAKVDLCGRALGLVEDTKKSH